jgi:hypothetical protein
MSLYFKNAFNEHLEKLINAKIQDKTMLNTKGNRAYPDAKYGHGLPLLRKLVFGAHSHQIRTQNSREGFWQPKGIPGEGNRHEK